MCAFKLILKFFFFNFNLSEKEQGGGAERKRGKGPRNYPGESAGVLWLGFGGARVYSHNRSPSLVVRLIPKGRSNVEHYGEAAILIKHT